MTGGRHTHFDVETNSLRQLHKHLFESGEGGLNEVASTVSLESLLLEVAREFHAFAHFRVPIDVTIPNRH